LDYKYFNIKRGGVLMGELSQEEFDRKREEAKKDPNYRATVVRAEAKHGKPCSGAMWGLDGRAMVCVECGEDVISADRSGYVCGKCGRLIIYL
jgi:hypothetical protein